MTTRWTGTPRKVPHIPSTRCSPWTIEYGESLGDGGVTARCTACGTVWVARALPQGGVGQTVRVGAGGCR